MVANKASVIDQKKSAWKYGVPISWTGLQRPMHSNKSAEGGISPDARELSVKFVANTHGYLDLHDDVLLEGAAKKTIKERGMMAAHIRDHKFETTAVVGDVERVYAKKLPLTTLGLNQAGVAEAIIFKSTVRRDYSEPIFKRYAEGRATQHSVGIRFVHLDLAVNDKSWEKEHKNWEEYINFVINKKDAEELGYFWFSKEYKLMEASIVLAGANPLTGTLEVSEKSVSTEEEPAHKLVSLGGSRLVRESLGVQQPEKKIYTFPGIRKL